MAWIMFVECCTLMLTSYRFHSQGVFLDRHFDFTVDIDLATIASWVEAIWQALVNLFKHNNTALRTNNFLTWHSLHDHY